MIRLGLIGPGKWGKNYIQAAKEAGNCEIAWVAGPEDWRNQSVVQGIIIATLPEAHIDIIRWWSPEMPMMVEKPLALSVAEVERIAEHLKEGVPFLVDYQHLFSPTFESCLRKRRSNERIAVVAGACGSTKRNYSLLWDYGPHFLAMCQSAGLWQPEKIRAIVHDDIASLRIQYAEGDLNLLVVVSDLGKEFYFETQDGFYDGTKEAPLVHAVRAFAQAVNDGGTGDTRFGIENTLEITRILEQAHVRGA